MSSEHSEQFSRMAFALHHQAVPEATVHVIVEYARSAIQCDDVGITRTRRNKISTAAATSMSLRTADQFQQSLGEGPSVATRDAPPYVLIDDTMTDDRWPRWSERVALLGLRSVLSVRLQTIERTYGAINFYSRSPHAFTSEDLAVATTFARHASVAVAAREEVVNLKIAVDSRNLLGQAQGILMERFKIDSDRAFDVLRRYSQAGNIKLLTVARHLIEGRHLPTFDENGAPTVESPSKEVSRPPLMTLTTRTEAKDHIIAVDGEIDLSTAPTLVDAAFTAIDAGHHRLIIDMSGTSFIDSSGLSAFILVQKAVSKHGGTLALVGISDRVKRVFTLAGLGHLIELSPRPAQASQA